MKKYLYSLLGTIIGGVICNVIFFAIGKLAIAFNLSLFNREEASRNFVIFLVLFSIFVITGGVKGFFVGKK